jgi:hypothetical protein
MRTLLLLALTAAAATSDVDAAVERCGLRPTEVREAMYANITGTGAWVPSPPEALRNLDGRGRAAAVQALGALARAYVASDAFAQRYSAWRTEQIGQPPAKPLSYDAYMVSQAADSARIAKEVDAQVAALPADQQAQVRAKLASVMKSAPPKTKALYDEAMGKLYQQKLDALHERERRYPADPKAIVRLALQRFLDQTADVDFNAKLLAAGGKNVFADERYEAKSDLWKRAFRAGKEPTAAARTYAQAWLKELK